MNLINSVSIFGSSSSMLTPAISLAFQKKISSYYQDLGLSSNVASFDDFTVESVLKHLTDCWNDRSEIRSKLTKNIPLLQDRAVVTATVIKALDYGRSVGEGIEEARKELEDLSPIN